jgi:hypothetical protein
VIRLAKRDTGASYRTRTAANRPGASFVWRTVLAIIAEEVRITHGSSLP